MYALIVLEAGIAPDYFLDSIKQLSPTDIMKFDWDEAKEKDTSISKDDIARLQAKANQFINTQN